MSLSFKKIDCPQQRVGSLESKYIKSSDIDNLNKDGKSGIKGILPKKRIRLRNSYIGIVDNLCLELIKNIQM
jgi:hypothetical protein